MKTVVLCLLAAVSFAAAAEIPDNFASRSISSTVVDAIEGARDRMPCGFPGLGIPPLAPLFIRHKDVDINTPDFRLNGILDNFFVHGLNDFEVPIMNVNVITSKVTFGFLFKNVHINTLYKLNLYLKKAGFTINLVGSGPAKFAIKNLEIKGTMKYSLGILSDKLKLKSLQVRSHIGDVDSEIEGILGDGGINHKMNDVLQEAFQLAINDNEEMITQTIESMALPMINNVLDQYKLSDLVGRIGGGDGEKVECVPIN